MSITIKIPLPWYSRMYYDPVRGRVHGGWRYAWLSAHVHQRSWYYRGFSFSFWFGVGLGAWHR